MKISQVQSAIEDGHKISNADHKGLEVGLVTARCGLESCGDILSYLRKISDRLQQAAKEAMKSAKHVITGMVFAAALAAGCKFILFVKTISAERSSNKCKIKLSKNYL